MSLSRKISHFIDWSLLCWGYLLQAVILFEIKKKKKSTLNWKRDQEGRVEISWTHLKPTCPKYNYPMITSTTIIHSWLKTLNKVIIEGICINIIKVIYNKPIANITFNGRELKAFPLRPGTGQDAHSHWFYSTQYWKFYPQQSDTKKKKGGAEKVSKLKQKR